MLFSDIPCLVSICFHITPLKAIAEYNFITLRLQEVFDAIICDPPYGVRAGGKKSVAKEHKVKCSETHIPSTDPYSFEECLKDLLHLAAKHLKLGARLVFFLPSAPGLDKVPYTLCIATAEAAHTVVQPALPQLSLS